MWSTLSTVSTVAEAKPALCLKEDVIPLLETAYCKLSTEMRPG